MSDKMSLEQATEILESNGVSGTTDNPIYFSAPTVSVAARIVITDHQRREGEARAAALDIAAHVLPLTAKENAHYTTKRVAKEKARATIKKFGDRNGME